MKLIQGLIWGDTGFRLVKEIRAWHPFPERIVFKALFGTYETFVGDVRIYAKPRIRGS